MLVKLNKKIAKIIEFTLKEKSKIIPNLHVKKIAQYHQEKNIAPKQTPKRFTLLLP
jgi:hypothetical protein